ncbi:MAG: V-type ATP synthase subunit K [bacterium ADurb.Bin157]|nr:MAG: V-type ATP synthase subunit K [bacterium ADurb.Bin157]
MEDFMLILGKMALGLIMGFGGLGSSLGVLAAGNAAAGGWAKEGKEGRPLSGKFTGLVGMPVSQTLYCLILYIMMVEYSSVAANGPVLFGIAIGVGMCQFVSAYAQGNIGGAGVRCLVENGGKGFGNIVVAMGIAESIALFALVTGILILNSPVMVKVAEAAVK